MIKSKSLLILVALSTAIAQSAPLTIEEATRSVADQFAKGRKSATYEGLDKAAPESITKRMEAAKAANQKLEFGGTALPLGKEVTMPYAVVLRESEKPKNGRALYISMHGGGQSAEQPGPHTWRVNDGEFQTQVQFAIGLYNQDGIYFIPRMADDRLGRWWHQHNQIAFDRVIDHAITHWGVNPDKVYLMGVSEGGYGTDILAPFMGDRFAGANAMAAGVGLGNPPANLRNLPFRTDVGENDTMFDRRPMAEKFHAELDRLHELDPAGYVHSIHVQPGRGHGIDYSQGIQWMSKHTRNPWPDRIVWINQPLDGIRRERFYWVSMPDAPEKGDIRVDARADKEKNTITVDVATMGAGNADGNRTHGKDNVAEAPRTPMSGAKLGILLRDELLDLDKPVTVICNGKEVFKGKVTRSPEAIARALAKRPDPAACPTAQLDIITP